MTPGVIWSAWGLRLGEEGVSKGHREGINGHMVGKLRKTSRGGIKESGFLVWLTPVPPDGKRCTERPEAEPRALLDEDEQRTLWKEVCSLLCSLVILLRDLGVTWLLPRAELSSTFYKIGKHNKKGSESLLSLQHGEESLRSQSSSPCLLSILFCKHSRFCR